MKSGFSLIELVVVIAIVAILSASAVPIYNQYKARVIVSSAYEDLSRFSKQIIEYYEMNGKLPGHDTIYYSGVPMAWAFRVVNSGDIYHMAYDLAPDKNGFLLVVTVKGLSGTINGYVDPSTAWGGLSTIRYAVRNVDGVWRSVCGVANVTSATPPSGTDVPLIYHPSKCNCAAVHDFAYGDSYGCLN